MGQAKVFEISLFSRLFLYPIFNSSVGYTWTETTTNIYARNNTDMINKAKVVLNSIFTEPEQCENFVRKKAKTTNCRIIQFPRKSSGAWK